MRSPILTPSFSFSTTARSTRRAAVRVAAPIADALRPHAALLRLALIFALSFALAFYLDARDEAPATHAPSATQPVPTATAVPAKTTVAPTFGLPDSTAR